MIISDLPSTSAQHISKPTNRENPVLCVLVGKELQSSRYNPADPVRYHRELFEATHIFKGLCGCNLLIRCIDISVQTTFTSEMPPISSYIFNSMQFLDFFPKICWRSPPLELAPPQGNPGSPTVIPVTMDTGINKNAFRF